MAARKNLVGELLELGSLMPWKACLAAAVVTGLLCEAAASALLSPVSPSLLQVLCGLTLRIFGILIPLSLLLGAFAGQVRRRHGGSLHRSATEGGNQRIRSLSWREFERLIDETFRRKGYEVTPTGSNAGDGGVDHVLTKDGKKLLVQCKHWKAQSVPVSVVRELNGVIAAERAAGGYVITSGTFTAEALAFAKQCPITLIDGSRLTGWLATDTTVAQSAPHSASPGCPGCGAPMVRRTARKGAFPGREFWGCSGYPRCRGTMDCREELR